jgi:hypothetical protein
MRFEVLLRWGLALWSSALWHSVVFSFLQNVGNHLQDNTVSQPRIPQSQLLIAYLIYYVTNSAAEKVII